MAQNVTETLPAIADMVNGWVPQLRGRCLPVTDANVTKDNVPTLPYAIVAPLQQTFTHNGGSKMTVQEDFILEIWLEPRREKTAKGESPFWSYYEYNALRNKLFTRFAAVRTPQNGKLTFISMDAESNFLATVLTFRMRATYDVCAEDDECEPPAKITFDLCQPRSPACPPEPEQEKSPCPVST